MIDQALPAKILFIQIGRRRYQIESFQQASEMYGAARDRAVRGASQVPPADIVDDRGEFVARISYNGRVWASREFDANANEVPLYDNRATLDMRVG